MGKKSRRGQRRSETSASAGVRGVPSSNVPVPDETAASGGETSVAHNNAMPSNLQLPETAPSMSQISGGLQATMQQMLFDLNSGEGSAFKEKMRPLKVTRAVRKKIKSLPKAPDQVWMINVEKDEMVEDASNSSPTKGYMCFAQASVTIVTKEKGSNGMPLTPNVSLSSETSDGLSFTLAMCANEFHDTYTINPLQDSELCLGTIAKACLEPGRHFGIMGIAGGASFHAARPIKVLFTKEGTMNLLREELLEMGIKQVGLASRKLIQSIRSTFAEKSETDNLKEAALSGALADPNNTERLANLLSASVGARSPYVPETRTPLGYWKPDPEALQCYPLSWWHRPPDRDAASYRHTMLFGWRTNLELACERCDKQKVRQLLQEHSTDSARDYAERRLLLNKAATRGLLTSCKMLVEWIGAGVDGVQSPDNKPEWRKAQQDSGDNNDSVGMTPLCLAAKEGNTAVVKYLISKGASVNITTSVCMRASPMHFAVLGGHLDCVKILFRNGANESIRDSTGCTPAMLASACFEGIVGHNAHNEAHRKIVSFFKNPDGNVNACSACGVILSRPCRCPCGLEIYCDEKCQQKRWNLHKTGHQELVDSLKL